MTALFLLVASALAADVERYPWQATVALEACSTCDPKAAADGAGAWRVPLPPTLRSMEDPVDGTDLAVLDSDGNPVPFAVVRGQGEPANTWLRVVPTADRDVYRIDDTDRPIDGLFVELPGQPSVATVQVFRSEGARWVPHGSPQLVWRHEDGDQRELDFPVVSGPLLVRLQYHNRLGVGDPDIDGFTRPLPDVPPSELTLPVVDWRLEEDGWARYTVVLPHPLPVRAVTLHPADELFDRQVVVTDRLVETWQRDSPSGRIRRFHIGGASVDELRVPAPPRNETDTLVVYVESRGDAPLDIPEITLEMEGAEILLLDPGPGPFTVLGGAPPRTGDSYDLVVAVPELTRTAHGTVEPSAVVDNPAYRPPELRTGLVQPGPEADLSRQHWSNEVEGGPGLARVRLTRDVLARGMSDQRDLRLVDNVGRQVPYLLRRVPADQPWPGVTFDREEVGSLSQLHVKIPDANVPISRVTLTTSTPRFSRQITLSRARGASLEPLRAFSWVGADQPTSLTLDVDAVVGDELLITIDNRDNPPLEIDAVELATPTWELVAWLPPEGVRLVYGDPLAGRPSYDLALMEHELLLRSAPAASLGPLVELTPPPASFLDRAVLLGGVGVLVLGLAGLTLSLLRKVPETEDSGDGGASEDIGGSGVD